MSGKFLIKLIFTVCYAPEAAVMRLVSFIEETFLAPFSSNGRIVSLTWLKELRAEWMRPFTTSQITL